MGQADNPPPTHRVWPWIWAALGIGLIVRTGLRDRGVITDHLEFGRRLLSGLALYAEFEGKPLHPPYPPSFGLLTAPFSLLPERLARFAWGALQVGCLWIIARRLRDLFLPQRLSKSLPQGVLKSPPRLHLLYVVATVLAARYILRDTHGGGGNLINLALVLASVQLARRGDELAAGAVLGFSLATKPVAVLVLPLMWMLGHRRVPGVAVATATLYLALALLFLRQGMTPFLTWFDGSVKYAGMNDLFAPPAQGFPPFSFMNQCLRCCVARFCGEVPPEFAADVVGFRQGLGLSPHATSWIARGLSLGLLLFTFGIVWRHRANPGSRPWAIAAVLSLSLLLSPISWKAHHVALIPTFFLIARYVLQGRHWAWGFATAYFALCVVGEQIVGKGWKSVQQSLYLTTIGTLAVLAICLSQVRVAGRDLPTGRPPD